MDIYQPPPGEAPAARHPLLEDIARELSSEVVFPTCFDAAAAICRALDDPTLGLAEIAARVAGDPLVGARILALANSAAYNPAGDPIRNLHKAVERLGLQNVRTAALAVATRQMLLAQGATPFEAIGRRLWAHSLHTAGAAYVLARRLSRIHPDDALLAGLIHDLGAFYLIFRGAAYDDLVAAPDAMLGLLADWHEGVGHTLSIALGLPQNVANAILDQDTPRAWPDPVHTLADVVHLANRLAGGVAAWRGGPPAEPDERLQALREQYGEEIETHRAALTAAFA